MPTFLSHTHPKFGSVISNELTFRGLQNRTCGLEASPKSTGSLDLKAFGSYGQSSLAAPPGELADLLVVSGSTLVAGGLM